MKSSTYNRLTVRQRQKLVNYIRCEYIGKELDMTTAKLAFITPEWLDRHGWAGKACSCYVCKTLNDAGFFDEG